MPFHCNTLQKRKNIGFYHEEIVFKTFIHQWIRLKNWNLNIFHRTMFRGSHRTQPSVLSRNTCNSSWNFWKLEDFSYALPVIRTFLNVFHFLITFHFFILLSKLFELSNKTRIKSISPFPSNSTNWPIPINWLSFNWDFWLNCKKYYI